MACASRNCALVDGNPTPTPTNNAKRTIARIASACPHGLSGAARRPPTGTLLPFSLQTLDAYNVLRCASMYAWRCCTRTGPVPSSRDKDIALAARTGDDDSDSDGGYRAVAGPHETTTRDPLYVVLYLMVPCLIPPAESQRHRPRMHKSPPIRKPLPPPHHHHELART